MRTRTLPWVALGLGVVLGLWWLVSPPAGRRTHYLLDLQAFHDDRTATDSASHLLLFNPGARPVRASVTFFFEDAEPASVALVVPPHTSLEQGSASWPVAGRRHFALRVDSSAPLVCQ